MTVTWLFCALYLWHSMFHPSRMNFFQSKKEPDSDANGKRALFIWENLPSVMKDWQPIKYTFCNLHLTKNRSQIICVPAGADHFRQYTVTGLFLDEMAFIDESDKTLAAVKPALGKIGKFTGVSSASPSTFKSLVFDEQ